MTPNRQNALPPVPASYGTPFVGWLDRLNALCADPELPQSAFLDKVASLADELPTLPMDWIALAVHLESAMGQAVLEEMEWKANIVGPPAPAPSRTAFAAPTVDLGQDTSAPRLEISFAPLTAAIEKLDRRTPIGARLSSAQWSRVALELRERAFFSARVENIRFLAGMQDMLHKRLSLERAELVEGRNVFVERGAFILAARSLAEQEGIDTTDSPDQRGTIRDIRSTKRLGLIYDMQTNMAQEYARWTMDHDEDVLAAYPAQRFERIESRKLPRPDGFWQARWSEAGAGCGWQGALERPMVALKTSPIWQGLSIFGTPWPPFDYGSGWGVVDVDRQESDELGLTKPALPVPQFAGGSGRSIDKETGREMGFNDVLEASVSDWRPDQVATLKSAFGDQVQESGGKVQWQGSLVRDFVDRALRDPAWIEESMSLGTATERTIVKVGDLADVESAALKVDARAIRAASRGRVPPAAADYELLPHIWRDPDEVQPGDKPGDLVFRKRLLGRTVAATFAKPAGKTVSLKAISHA